KSNGYVGKIILGRKNSELTNDIDGELLTDTVNDAPLYSYLEELLEFETYLRDAVASIMTEYDDEVLRVVMDNAFLMREKIIKELVKEYEKEQK
ncbi:MAG: hypothetical protein FWE68_04105, partial [Defluviitaleaceae bacterium]|nr:hypothetical protein [Defluviitaleaceae bacterium]